ncbi:hypothetical protein GGS20DRAFT_82175 [Poronia punctata]|nr:hypothetical protein GGS20DRAFT_82175 [Poronia punctata]
MCHGHPHYHPCSHTSVKWLYCPEAIFDLTTGYEAPCANPLYATVQPVNTDCPLQNCNFKALKGSWNCCICGNGPNTQGWCTVMRWALEYNPLTKRMENMEVPCGHGCCSKCSHHPSSSRASSPETSFAEARNGRSGRKSHSSSHSHGHHSNGRSSGNRRSSTYGFDRNFSAIAVGDDEPATSTAAHDSSKGSRDSACDTGIEYSSKKTKTTSSSKRKGYKSRSQYHD